MQDFKYASDAEIYQELGKAFDQARRANGIQDAEVIKQGNVTSDALNKFRQNKGGVTLLNFIKLMRGIGELDALQKLFENVEETEQQRIRKPKPSRKITWGDEQ